MTEQLELFKECNCKVEPGKFDITKVDPDCKKVWALLGKGLTKGVFQLESRLGKRWCKELRPESIEHLTALGSILRPGCLQSKDEKGVSATAHYCSRKNGLEEVIYAHPALEPILKSTYGLIVFQEQAIQIAIIIAGFSPEEADALRKAIGKKLTEEMAKVKTLFLEGVRKTNVVPYEVGEHIFEQIEKSQRYSFNKSHAHCYAIVGYWSAFEKAHMPLDFFTSYLRYAHSKQKPLVEINELINEAKLLDISVNTPKLCDFQSHFWNDGKAIHFGLTDVKGVGDKQVDKLIELNTLCIGFTGMGIAELSWYKFLIMISDKVASNVIENLICVNALDCFGVARSAMLEEFRSFASLTDKEKKWIRKNCHEEGCLSRAILKLSPTTGERGGTSRKKRAETVRSIGLYLQSQEEKLRTDSHNWIVAMEKKNLGAPITYSKVEGCDTSEVNISCKEFSKGKLPNLEGASYLVFGVVVDEVRELLTKNGKSAGSKMAFVVVSDKTASLSMTVFPKEWRSFASILTEGNTVLIQASKDAKQDSCIIKNVFQI